MDIKENMVLVSEQSAEIETPKKNQMEILELKITVIKIKIGKWR